MSQSSSLASSLTRNSSQRSIRRSNFNSVFHQLRENIRKPFALAHSSPPAPLPFDNSVTLEAAQPQSRQRGSGMGGGGNGGVSTILQEKSNGTATPSAHSTSDTLHQVAPPPHHVLDPRDTSKHTFFARAFRSASAEAFDDANRPGQQGQGQGKEAGRLGAKAGRRPANPRRTGAEAEGNARKPAPSTYVSAGRSGVSTKFGQEG